MEKKAEASAWRNLLKRFLNVTVLAIVASANALGGTPTKKTDQDSLAIQVAVGQLDNDRVKAMLQGDTAALDRICADDLIYTHSDGTVETKAKWIESIRSGKQRYERFDRDDVQVHVYGGAAVVTGRSQVKVFSGTHGEFLGTSGTVRLGVTMNYQNEPEPPKNLDVYRAK